MTTGLWIDPFANKNKFATITNDLNTEFDTDYHLANKIKSVLCDQEISYIPNAEYGTLNFTKYKRLF
jgi:hypothetical protein